MAAKRPEAEAVVLVCKDYFNCQTCLDLLQLRLAQVAQRLHLAAVQSGMAAAPVVLAA
jgi:hypothetical protein